MNERARKSLWIVAAGLGTLAVAAPAAAGAAALKVHPEEVHLAPGADATVIAVVDNRTERGLRSVVVSPVAPASVTVTPAASEPAKIPAGGSHAFTFTVARSGTGALPATIVMRTDYETSTNDGIVERVDVTSFDVAAQPVEPASSVADVEVQAPDTVIDEFRDLRTLVQITNTSSSPIEVTQLTSEVSEDSAILVKPAALEEPLEISPGDQVVLAFELSLDPETVHRSGEEVVTWRAEISWGKDLGRTGRQVVSQTVKVGVFSEGDVAGLLKIPSLLFLPGFVLLMAVVLMAKWRPYPAPAVETAISGNALMFAFLTLVASLGLGWAYRVLEGRDLRAGYGFGDILGLCVFAFAGAVIVKVATTGWLAYLDKKRKDRTVVPRDDAPVALAKLGRRGSLILPRAIVKATSENVWVYGAPSEAKRVVGPSIAYRVEDPKLSEDVGTLRNEGRANDVAKALLDAAKTGAASVDWSPQEGGKIRTLVEMEVTALHLPPEESSVLREA